MMEHGGHAGSEFSGNLKAYSKKGKIGYMTKKRSSEILRDE